jgi:hypothetical protein
MCDTPQALENILLPKGDVIESAVNGISLLRLGIFTPRKNFKLGFLLQWLDYIPRKKLTGTYHGYRVG